MGPFNFGTRRSFIWDVRFIGCALAKQMWFAPEKVASTLDLLFVVIQRQPKKCACSIPPIWLSRKFSSSQTAVIICPSAPPVADTAAGVISQSRVGGKTQRGIVGELSFICVTPRPE